MALDDPRNRMRGALRKLGHEDKIPEDASEEELRSIIDGKVEKGLISKEHAEKLKGTMKAADQHSKRLEQMDQELFGN